MQKQTFSQLSEPKVMPKRRPLPESRKMSASQYVQINNIGGSFKEKKFVPLKQMRVSNNTLNNSQISNFSNKGY